MHINRRRLLGAGLATMASATLAFAASPKRPLIVAHRGASGYKPEHTVASYELAIKMGADFIEPDVVSTKDGHLVVRHDPVLTDSTDILAHPEFADRKRTMTFPGFSITDFFVSDFTLAELKTLRCKQVFADRSHADDGKYQILTLQEVIDIAQAGSKTSGRTIGIYPEIKFPTLHQQAGLAIEDKLLDVLKRAGMDSRSSPVIIQSFETANLKYLRGKTQIRLMQLVSGSDSDPKTGAVILKAPDDKPFDWLATGRAGDYRDMLTADGLKEVATYADIVAPWKRYLVSFADGKLIKNQAIIDNAHASGLQVHTWTVRTDRLDPFYAGNAQAEYLQLFHMGVDGVFTDFPDDGVKAREAFMAGK